MKEVAMELEALRKFTTNTWTREPDDPEFEDGTGSTDLYTVSIPNGRESSGKYGPSSYSSQVE